MKLHYFLAYLLVNALIIVNFLQFLNYRYDFNHSFLCFFLSVFITAHYNAGNIVSKTVVKNKN
jgi:hypothetical protein